ncbi:hypothetical protein CS006_04330 [Bifidobacterium primatium]|uniref:SpaA-like prealbumin fold domain-containing protein n=2 Tax=Bifidobacterium primatium TaxID=2045438 RepID=A0A2M9H8Z8_9BIFI|nr:hypothetical protein CS006_04330 [Bifidobacterium primatium]
MNTLGDSAATGRRRGAHAIAAMAAAAAMLAVGIPAAGAVETAGAETESTVAASPSQSSSASNDGATSAPSSQNPTAQGATPKTQKKDSQKKAAAKVAAPKAAGDCAAVRTWDVLKSCVDGAATDGSATTVTLAASIEVPTDTTDTESTPLDQNHVLYVNNGAKITLKADDGAGLDGTRSGGRKGSVIYVYPGGSLTIAGGTYQSIGTKERGAVIMNDGTVNVTGGTFRNNTSAVSGGVISSSGTVSVTGGTFTGNGQSPADDCSTDATVEQCHQSNLGGGAIHSTGSLLVQGNVTFDGNYAKSWSWRAGGGAIWASGKLWVKNATDGTKPKFVNNYTSVAKPERAADGTWTDIQRGGAGGAIFLNGDSSMAWLTGGSYTNNVSGYLGGAVYTEEDSTTYVGKAVAFDNAAGHFGGGLWFCPSGNATASQGGNIALFDNDVNTTLDGNTANTAADGNTVTAGDDLAIMNPYHKWYGDPNKFTSNSFHLLDTWFTDRSNPAVTWYRDGTPLMESSGYFDSWLPDSGGWYGHGAIALQAKADPAYPTEKVTTPTTLNLYVPGTVHAANGAASTMTVPTGDGNTNFTTGVALKAQVNGATDAERQATRDEAKGSAQLSMSGNGARLSGGAFGSNGVVIFASPSNATWEKTAVGGDGKPSADNPLAGAVWKLTVTQTSLDTASRSTDSTPYQDGDLRPADCQVAKPDPYQCWTSSVVNGEKTWTMYVTDKTTNGATGRDNNPEPGVVEVDNLAAGDYKLTEETAPPGYEKSSNVYAMKVYAAEAGKLPKDTEITLESGPDADKGLYAKARDGHALIGNRTNGKVSWEKTDGANPIDGSVWRIERKTDDGTWTAVTNLTGADGKADITDCVDTACTGADKDSRAGWFTVEGIGAAGTYRLVETQAPEGFWQPGDSEKVHEFEVKVSDGAVSTDWGKASNVIANTPAAVTWRKTDKDTGALITASASKWELKRYSDASHSMLKETLAVTDCFPNTSCSGTNDTNTAAGVITVQRLKPGYYTLVETQAPNGYNVGDDTYTFVIERDATEHVVSLETGGRQLDDNKVPNEAKKVAMLPFTGGMDGRGWLVFGGLFTAAAALALAAVNEYRKRKGLA